MTTERDRINARLTDEARAGLRTRVDLDAFLALDHAGRAARWASWSYATKADAVIQQLDRLGYDWTEALVDEWIARYDAKYAPSPIEAAVCAALERLATENADHARTARAAGEQGHAAVFQRGATSYTNALIEYRAGVRPERLPRGAWLLPSRRVGEAPHIVTMERGIHVCCCKASSAMHWPIALIVGIEISLEDMQREDDARPVAPSDLGRRLCEARARLMDAA